MAQTSSSWRDLPRRILTVAIGVPTIILLLQNTVTSWLFFQGAHLICLLEWRALVPTLPLPSLSSADKKRDNGEDASSPLSQYLMSVFSIASFLITILPPALLPLALMASGILLRLLPHLPMCQKKVKSFEQIYLTIQHYQFGLLYLSIGFHFILQIAVVSDRGAYHIGNLLFVVWMSDTGALIFGRVMKSTTTRQQQQQNQAEISKHNQKGFILECLQSISPGKTMYGLFGAIITGPISAILYPMAFASSSNELSEVDNTLAQRAMLGFILAIAGIIGDLAESSVKRLSTKKDSGKLLPGHGGVVDRFDSLLSSAVVYYYWMSV